MESLFARHQLWGFILFFVPLLMFLSGTSGSQNSDCKAQFQNQIFASPVRLVSSLPDFTAVDDLQERKHRFFDILRPIIEAENDRVLKEREFLLRLYSRHLSGHALRPDEIEWLEALKAEYEITEPRIGLDEALEKLTGRVDIVPVMLALVQAASESGWGTSRFARLGNNVFGHYSSSANGIIPNSRPSGATHTLASFTTVNEAVREYIRNINTHPAYAEFRRLRAEQRGQGRLPDAHELAAGLVKYSERGEDYVVEVRDLLRINKPLLEG